MKTIKFGLLLAFLSSPIFIFSNFRPNVSQPVGVSIQGDAALNQLHVSLVTPRNTPVTLRVLEPDGCLLHEERFPAYITRVRANLNLSAIPNGTYQIEISGPNRVQTHRVHLSPAMHPTLKRQIDIWPAD